jgi:hypothetical protein
MSLHSPGGHQQQPNPDIGCGKRTVTFGYKDYANGGRQCSLSLSVEQFLERFCPHILPPHFVKIRSYGLLSNRNRSKRIEQARALEAA